MYKPVECQYLISVLKHKSVQVRNVQNESFDSIYNKARKTLKHQMKKLLLKKQFYMIDNQYKVAENKTQTSENLIKILSRCIKMYDAQ